MFISPDPLAYSKKLVNKDSGVFNFSLTNEKNVLIDLNGLNMTFTLMLYKDGNVYDVINNYVKYKIEKEEDRPENVLTTTLGGDGATQ